MRFPPIPEADWTAEQRAFAAGIVAGPRGRLRGPFVALMHSPGLAARVQEVGAYLRFGTALPKDLIEIAILVTARHYDCGHIWRSHREQALALGVEPQLIAALAARRAPDAANPQQTTVIEFCGQLLGHNRVETPTFDAAVANWGRQGAIDLAGLVGYYGLLAMVLDTAQDPDTTESDPFDP